MIERNSVRKKRNRLESPQVFISCCPADRNVAYRIFSALEAVNIRCWLPDIEIPTEESWSDSIFYAINESEVMVVVVSSETENSDWVIDEINLAQNNNIKIIPFQVESVPKSGILKLLYSRYHFIVASSPPLKKHIDSLVKAIRACIENPEKYKLKKAEDLKGERGDRAIINSIKMGKILVIDDNDEHRGAIQYLLEKEKYNVLTAPNGIAGIELLKRHDDIWVVIVDLILLGFSGIEVLKRIRNYMHPIKRIVITSYDSELPTPEAEKLKVFSYLNKPISENTFIFAVKSAFKDLLGEEVGSIEGQRNNQKSLLPTKEIGMETGKILVIDDNDDTRNAIQYLLEKEKYKVLTAQNGIIGIELLKKHNDIRVVTLDLSNFKFPGIELLKKLKDWPYPIRRIVITAYDSELPSPEAEELKVFSYLNKPISKNILIFAVKSAFKDLNVREIIGHVEKEDVSDSDTIVDNLENELRNAVSRKLYEEGKKHLREIIKNDNERKERLKEELGYIYNFGNLEADENQWLQKEGQIEWRRKVWQILSMRNNFELINLDSGESYEEKPEDKIDSIDGEKELKKSKTKDKRTPEEIGEELEIAVLMIFKDFFNIWEEDNTHILEKARQQDRGTQFGHDLKFVCGRLGDREIRFLIECKNYSKKIATKDIADKLMQVDEYYDKYLIDHWILISPNEDVSNELDNLIDSWEKKGKFSFKVQAWTPATRVKEFFGLNPDIYDKIIKDQDVEIHPKPKDWSEEKKQEVIDFWKQKLEPPIRLPQGWEDYLRYNNKLLLEPDEIEFERRYNDKDYVDMYFKDETGTKLSQPLEEKLYDWLEEPVSKSPTLFLLGEFGDGKTFFTYVITRKLVEKFKKSPKNEWLPVRFALKNFESGKFKSIQEFIEHRLKDFRADIAGWNDLRTSGYKIMAILDGFDEISKELDPKTIQENIKILINCYSSTYLSKLKILITSRKHFFENHKEKNWLIDKLDYPQLLHLAPIDRKATEEHLKKYAGKIGLEKKLNKLKECHDPIGLASKPLFLNMVQSSLIDLKVEELNEYSLYETYILNSIKRKLEYLYDEKNETPKSEIIGNLLSVMELIAQTLHQRNLNFVYLSDIRAKAVIKTWLWKISNIEANQTLTIGKENAIISTRSLLRRVEAKNQSPTQKRPVDFCHRSMREYFVARAVCNMIEKDQEEAEKFLISCFLSHEILFFAGEIMKHRDFNYESNLLHLIQKTREVMDRDRVKLGCLGGNAVNLLYQYKSILTGNDWKNLVLDGAILPGADLSGKDFSGTSLQFANLDNVNFTDSDFSNCNLTEVRIEETTPVQSIAVSTGEKVLCLYHDGIIREWSYQRPHGATSTNLIGNKTEKNMKLIALPGNGLTLLCNRYLYFYDRNDRNLDIKAAIEINPNFKIIKATVDYLLLKENDDKKNRLLLVDLNKEAIVKSFICTPFTLCDHLDDCALVIFNQDEELQIIDITPGKKIPLIIPTGQKVACISTCKYGQLPGQYLLGLGLYNGIVQIWQIQVKQWKFEKLLEQKLHNQGKPIKDISFIDECRIVSGGLDKTIKLLNFNQDGQIVGKPIEFKMILQCQGMKIDGMTRKKIEQKKLQELINKISPAKSGTI